MAAFLRKRAVGPSVRPNSRQYGHKEIRSVLFSMSHGKCYYCERKLREEDGEVEHFVGVATEPELAFDWPNLYLSCRSCNQAKRRRTYAVNECLDPCNPDVPPEEYLTFDDEYVRPKNNSEAGRKTIQKYRLDRDELDHLRVKQLHRFERFLRMLQEKKRASGNPITKDELAQVARFGRPEHEFSLMFRVYLEALNA